MAFMMAWIKTVASGVDPGRSLWNLEDGVGCQPCLVGSRPHSDALVPDVVSVAPAWLALRAHETRFVRH